MDINEYLNTAEDLAKLAVVDLDADDFSERIIAKALLSMAFSNLAMAKMRHSKMPAHK